MSKSNRKKFFIKDNFRLNFIIGFTLFLFFEIITEYLIIYQQSKQAINKSIFKSHITIDRGSQIIWPIIAKINTYGVLITILVAVIIISIAYHRMNKLFKKIITGLKRLKDYDTSVRIALYGSRNTRNIIKEFNHAAACLRKQQGELQKIADSLIQESKLEEIKKLHDKLHSLLINKLKE